MIDPRQTATCDIADLHLRIRPGADAALFNALLVDLENRNRVDSEFVQAHTRRFPDALAAARADAESAEERTGLDAESLRIFFDWFAGTDRIVTFFSQGVNQASNGTDKANAIINAHLATGAIGRSGAGPFSITGQPNAMGGREVGGMANQLAAHRSFTEKDIEQVAGFWSATDMAARPGLKAVEMFQAVADGSIQAIWIMGTNPAVSLPHASAVGRALAACPLVVVSDCVAETETGRYAHVRLPAQGWGEKDGTVTNSERRISRQRGFLEPPGEARPDWWAVTRLARKLGHGKAFPYESPAEIFREHAALSGLPGGADRFDIGECADLSEAEYGDLEPRQWGGASPFEDHRFSTADGRARFVPVAPHLPLQQPSARFPFVLNSGRLRDQWHTMTRTGSAAKLLAHTDTPADRHPSRGCGPSRPRRWQPGRGRQRRRSIARHRQTDSRRPVRRAFCRHSLERRLRQSVSRRRRGGTRHRPDLRPAGKQTRRRRRLRDTRGAVDPPGEPDR